MTLLFAKGSESKYLAGGHTLMGATSVSGRLPPEVIQRIVRQNFGRFRLCYENGLRSNPNLRVSKPTIGKIGTLRASVVDIGVADGAVNDDPTCPAKACANFLGYPQWGEPYGIAGKSVSRFYLADVRYGGKRHLFVAVIEATGASQLKAFLPEARKLIASVRVPASSA